MIHVFRHVYIGSADVAKSSEGIAEANIGRVINVTADYDNVPNVFESSIHYLNIPVPDIPSASAELASYFGDAVDFIESASGEGKNVLVHCLYGRSRSATIILAYMIKQHRTPLKTAMATLLSVRPSASPNVGFYKCLVDLERSELGRVSVDLTAYAIHELLTLYQGCFDGTITADVCHQALEACPVTSEGGVIDAMNWIEEHAASNTG